MRKRFEPQYSLFSNKMEDVFISHKFRDAMPKLMAALRHLFLNAQYRDRVLDLIDSKLPHCKSTGRPGLNLWQLFVLAQCRLCLSISYDRLHHMSNHDMLLRKILMIEDSSLGSPVQLDYQRIYDNVSLIDDSVLSEINDVIVEMGHEVFKKKETEALRLKTDSYVVETNVHFPTDYNLLYDSARKSLDTVAKVRTKHPELEGWRKIGDWYKSMKRLMRSLGRVCSLGGANKKDRVEKAARNYLKKALALSKKLKAEWAELPITDSVDAYYSISLGHYIDLLDKHIDLLDRRLLKGETIPHEEKLFSIFEQYTEWISKGKSGKRVELGKKVSITTDQYHLIVDYRILDHQADSQIVIPTVEDVTQKYEVGSWSFDKGYWHHLNKEFLKTKGCLAVMPKKGKCTIAEKEEESHHMFKTAKRKHSAIESNINELEHRSLNRCPDRGYQGFKKHVGLSIISYNLHKIGSHLLKQARLEQRQSNKAA